METTEGTGKQQVVNSLSRVLNNMNMSAILGVSGGGQTRGRTHSSSAGEAATDGACAVSAQSFAADADASIVKKGYLKKYKNLKSRFFVLRRHTSATNHATLEYYDNEAKFLGKQKPRRQFPLNQCIGIQEKRDSKLPFAVDIFIKQDSHCLVAANHIDSQEWLQALQTTVNTSHDGHVWPVEVLKRGLGGSGLKVPTGPCYLILATRQLAIVHKEDYSHCVDIALNTIRRCYITEEYFCLEMGRLASTGSGTLSLKTQDSNISDNIDKLVKKAMNDQMLSRNRTFSVSTAEGTRTAPRDRSDSLPARPSSSIGGGFPTAPLSSAGTQRGHCPPPPMQELGIKGVGGPTAQNSGKCHHSPWEVNSRRCRHVDDGRVGGSMALSPEMAAPHCTCGGIRGTLPTHQEGANETENYLNMSPGQQPPQLRFPLGLNMSPGQQPPQLRFPLGAPPSDCQHQSSCESGSSSHCVSPLKVDTPSGMREDPSSSLTSPNSNDYLDMGRGFSSGVSSPPPLSGSLLSPRGCQDRDGGCVNCNPCGHGGYCPVHRNTDTSRSGSLCSTSHHVPCCWCSHYCGSSSGSSSRGWQQHALNCGNSGSLSRRTQQQQGYMPPPAALSSSQPDSSWDSGNYMDMTPTNPTQPKPIPGCLMEEDFSPSTACSSFTSCAGTSSSDRFGRLHSSNVYSPEEGVNSSNDKQQLPHCCVVHHNLDSARSSNQDALSNMDTDSVPDVEDSVDDILDGMPPETRRRLDSMDRPSADGGSDRGSGNGLDDMDLDMDMDTDQVDSGAGTTTNSITTSTSMIGGGSRGGSVSARACLETVVASSCGGGIGCSCGGRPPVPPLRDEDELMSLERPFRTSSVGSKQDFSRRKNKHPEMPSSSSVFSNNEPSRVRAFSVGSRVSLKLLGGLSGSSCRHTGGGGATSPGAPCGGGVGGPFGHGSGCACATSTASSTSSTPLSGAARFLSQQYKGGGGLVPGENNYIGGGQHPGPSTQQHAAAYFLMNHGAVSPSSSCSSSSSFSPYTEFCSPTGGPLGSARGTSAVKSKSTSAPMLGISCASRSWSDTSGSYFRNLFTPRSSQHERQREDLMYLDFSKNHKSSDHIAAHLHDDGASSSKDKKSLSIEKIMSTFKHRSSTKIKNKRGVSEGDTSSVSSRGGGPGGGGAIEIPSNHSDYFQMDFNPSPRSNNSNTSTNSDVPLAGYLPMRPGASLSFSSTCSTDYVDMDRGVVVSVCSNSSEAADGGYLLMSSPRTSVDMFYTPPTSSVLEGYVDMTQGAGGLSISADSSSSGSLSSRHRKTSNTYSPHVSSIELPSPKEEFPQFSYLHEIDPKGQQKDKKKGRRKSVKESGKRKKSDSGTGDSISETIKSKGSSHLASFSSFLTRKNSQSSSAKTPLSPNGSPLPKSSRSSNSPFASLGRKSSSKESRDKSNPPVSQSPSSGMATSSVSPGFPSSPSNFSSGFLLGTLLTPGFVASEASENENYYSMEAAAADGLVSLPSNPGSFPRNHSNKELGSFELNKHAANRSSGSFDLASASLLTGSAGRSEVNISSGGSGVSSSSSPCCNNHHQHACHCGRTETALCNATSHHNCHHEQLHYSHHHSSSFSCELKDRGEPHSHDDAQNSYVNFSSGPDSSSLPANATPFNAHIKTCCCSNNSSGFCSNYPSAVCSNNSSRHSSCPRLTSVDKLGQIEHSHHGSVSSRPSSELGRVSESSLEDGRSSSACSPPQQSVAQETASYVNMCPLNVREKLSAVSNLGRNREMFNSSAGYCEASKSASNTPRTGTPCNERKILNTDQANRSSMVLDYASDYLEMDMRKACLHKTNNSNGECSHLGSGSSSSMTSSSPCVPTAVSGAAPPRGVVKRPTLPPLLLGARTDPSVPLEKLSITERGGGGRYTVTNPASSLTSLGSSDCMEAVSCDRTTCSSSSNNNNNNSSSSLGTPNVSCGQDCRAACGESNSCSAGSSSERCRSHSGPGAPEANRLGGQGSKDSIGLDVCEEGRRGEGEGKAQSVCSSPVSYSPPTSPSLASSSKSSLSEGGLSSASSTCTVVNVGLRLQQQQNRQSQGSGSSISTNTDCVATSTALPSSSWVVPSPITTSTSSNTSDVSSSSRSSALSTAAAAGLFTVSRASQIRQVVSQLPRAAQSSSRINQTRDGSSTTTTTSSSTSPAVCSTSRSKSSSSVEGQQDVVYAYLDLAPPKRDIIHSGGSGSPASKRRLMPASSTSQGSGEVAGGSVSCSTSTVGQTGDDNTVGSCPSGTSATSPSNYVEIDFKKSESLRNTCIIRDALRH